MDKINKFAVLDEHIHTSLSNLEKLRHLMSMHEQSEAIEEQGKYVHGILSDALNIAIRRTEGGLFWDGMILGSLNFIVEVLESAREQLLRIMEEVPEQVSEETVH